MHTYGHTNTKAQEHTLEHSQGKAEDVRTHIDKQIDPYTQRSEHIGAYSDKNGHRNR
jgi:hypothetical protein